MTKVIVLAEHKIPELERLFAPGVVFIDDELEHIKAGQALGYTVVWKRTRHNEGLDVPPGVVTVDTFKEFVELDALWKKK